MVYIAGFVAAVPTANKDAYLKHAQDAMDYFRGLGVTRAVEAWGDDVSEGEVTDFRRSVDGRDGETIVFAWQEYPDKQTYHAAQEKMMSDMENGPMDMPFDAKRMIYGGFSGVFDKGNGSDMGYVDGALTAVPRDAKEAYTAYDAALNAVIFEYGATRIVDGWGDDVPDGEVTDFRRAVKAGDGEDVLFSWIEWPSKAVRDQAWPKIFADPRMHEREAPFDEGRRVFGGFTPLLDG